MSLKIVWRKGFAQVYGTHGGIRIRESLGTRDPKEAERKLVKIQSRLHRAEVFGEASVATFASACNLYLEQGGDATYLKPIIEAFGMRLLSSIKPGEIHDLAKKLKPDAKASTRNRHVISPCRAVINFAAERGLCSHIRVKGFKEAKVIRKAVDRDWIDKFMAHAPHRHLGLLALFMFTTGARISEAVRLTPDDVDLAGLKATLDKTKNGNPRVYHLTRELADQMRSLPPKLVRDNSWRVFGYMTRNAPQAAWDGTVKRAKLPYACRHEAGRHSFATQMIVRGGKDIKTTMDLGGWESSASLMKYLHSENLGGVAEGVFGASSDSQDQASSDTKLAHTYNLKLANLKK